VQKINCRTINSPFIADNMLTDVHFYGPLNQKTWFLPNPPCHALTAQLRCVLWFSFYTTRTRKPCARKPRDATAIPVGFHCHACCISFSSSYEYQVDFSTLPHRCVVFLVTYMLFEIHQKWRQCCFRFRGESQCPECCETKRRP